MISLHYQNRRGMMEAAHTKGGGGVESGREQERFDRKLAQECARAFSASTGLGCTLSDTRGRVFGEYGYGCQSCGLCAAARLPREKCTQAHIYGMSEAERFGGRYIYFCPMGLTCFVSPIVGEDGAQAKITAGPFIMVDKPDFAACELEGSARLGEPERAAALAVLERIPFVPPQRVEPLSVLLFMAVGFLNNVSAENRLLDSERAGAIQGQITSYILEMKAEGQAAPYPIGTERALLQSISQKDQAQAQKLLNELLGAILFSCGGDMPRIQSRLYELLVLISRTAIDNGADCEQTLRLCHEYRARIGEFATIDALCLWLSGVMGGFVRSLFGFADAKHANLIHRCTQHIAAHYAEHITLEDAARMVYLSPAYLSRVFKQETGQTFNEYLNGVRIRKAQELLRHRELRMTDIALLVGYEDQSYFTKVFKRTTGMLPRAWREKQLSPGRKG